MKVPSCSYVSHEIAYMKIKEFIKNKEVSILVKLVDLYDINS